jgi:hypothetical protein
MTIQQMIPVASALLLKNLQLGNNFKAKKSMWIGAKVGLFCINPNMRVSNGYADFDWLKME